MITTSGLWKRAALFQSLRQFFRDRGYLEVDTPVRIPAPAPEAYIEPEESGSWFLQTSPELCMKRLLAAGNPKLFQICKCFRKGERGTRHLTEFSMLEWYRAGTDYHGLMQECEELFAFLGSTLAAGNRIAFGGRTVSLDAPWERLTVRQAFDRFAPVSLEEAMRQDLFDETLVAHIEPQLGLSRPALLYDYPAALGALARLKQDDPAVAERFELYINGLELANGFSELTDQAEQRRRFLEERRKIHAAGRCPGPMPERFLAALPDMPPAAGIAMGIDRLAMVFFSAGSIDEVLPFTPEEL